MFVSRFVEVQQISSDSGGRPAVATEIVFIFLFVFLFVSVFVSVFVFVEQPSSGTSSGTNGNCWLMIYTDIVF